MSRRASATCALSATTAVAIMAAPAARADDKRLNDGVVANVYTVQRQAGCTNDVTINPQLQLAAQWHTLDLLNNRHLNDDTGSDGSTPQDRAHAAGFRGKVAETVAINPAVAISGIELINQWYYNPAFFRDHVRLRQHPDRGVVRKQPGSHRRGGRLRTARSTFRDAAQGSGNRTAVPGGRARERSYRPQPRLRRQRRDRIRHQLAAMDPARRVPAARNAAAVGGR